MPGAPVTLAAPAAELAGAGYRPTAPLELVPYYSWANRAPSTMRVWLPFEIPNK
jgi:uncharacterized protein